MPRPTALVLQPWQVVRLWGLSLSMKRVITWDDVLRNSFITFRLLLEHVQVPVEQLYALQPDGQQWVVAERVSLLDCGVMADKWKIHPLRDMHTPVRDLLLAGFSADDLHRMGVCFKDLQEQANGDVRTLVDRLVYFNFHPYDWVKLGLPKRFVQNLSSTDFDRLFGIHCCNTEPEPNLPISRAQILSEIEKHPGLGFVD